jgi:hypothetical protein
LKFIDYTEKVENMSKMRTLNAALLPADICAYLGKYKEASLLYVKNNTPSKAVEMYTSLKMFDKAMEVSK